MKTENWTAADEAAFNEMFDRRKAVMEKQRAAVAAVVGGFFFHNMTETNIVDELIEHAEAVRDALAAYDSGVRQISGG